MRLILISLFAVMSSWGRETPLMNGRLEGDLNANGHTITNLPPGFFPEGGGVSSNDVRRMIVELAPIPGNYETVSNRAMTALQQHQDISGKADKADTYTKAQVDAAVAAVPRMSTNDVCAIVTNEVSAGWTKWVWSDGVNRGQPSSEAELGNPDLWTLYYSNRYWTANAPTNATSLDLSNDEGIGIDYLPTCTRRFISSPENALGLARLTDLTSYISTNNAAFVNAVTNCPVAIAASDAEALAEWGIYGGGGTIGALLAALAAAVAALKRGKVTTISAQSTDVQYPSAKCVWDIVGDVESALAAINGTAQTSQSGNGGSGT